MADDPFAGYAGKSAPQADPFAGYGGTASAPPQGGGGAAYQPGWLGKISDIAANSATLGVGDLATAGLGQLIAALGGRNLMPSVAQAQAQRAQERTDVGPWASGLAEAAGYAMPGKIIGPVAQGVAGAGVAGAALEGATAGGISGAAANPQAPISGAGMGALGGGALGAGAGALTKYAVNPLTTKGANWFGKATGMLSDPGDVTAATKAARDAAYDQLKSTPLDPADTRQALQGVRNAVVAMDPTGGFQKNAPRSMAVLDNLQDFAANTNDINAHDLVALGLDKLRNIPDTAAAGGENELKPAIQTGLENFLASGPAAGQLSAAKAAHQDYANAQALQQWSQSLKGFGQSPAGAAQKVAETYYPDPNSPEYQALSSIAQAAGGGGQSAYNLMHMIDPLLGYVGASVGGGPGAMAGEIAGHMMKPGLGAALSKVQQGATQRAIGGAYPALTGEPPTLWSPDLGPAVRALLFGKAASAGF